MKTHSAEQITLDWKNNDRWEGVERPYTADDVVRLRGTVPVEYTLARRGAERLWRSIHDKPYVNALGALTGNQAMQQVKAGLQAIYLSGWQVAADANTAGTMYPDQSLYPVDSVPNVVRKINKTLLRADQIHHAEGKDGIDWLVPIVADAEAGFGGVLNAYELMTHMIEAGAAGVHFEDQLASAKKCGHMGGKVLVPTQEAVQKLVAARLAADVAGVPTLIVARTDAMGAGLVTSDVDDHDKPFLTGKRTVEGFMNASGYRPGHQPRTRVCAVRRSDLVRDVHAGHGGSAPLRRSDPRDLPGKKLAYNCSPSFNWKKNLDETTIADFQKRLGEMGYAFQFITLAGFHALNYSMFQLARGYRDRQMAAYVELQEAEFAAEKDGYTAAKHQREVGTGYFDTVNQVISGSFSSLSALTGSTEEDQFHPASAA